MPYYILTLRNAEEIHLLSQQLVLGADLLLNATAPCFKPLTNLALDMVAARPPHRGPSQSPWGGTAGHENSLMAAGPPVVIAHTWTV